MESGLGGVRTFIRKIVIGRIWVVVRVSILERRDPLYGAIGLVPTCR